MSSIPWWVWWYSGATSLLFLLLFLWDQLDDDDFGWG